MNLLKTRGSRTIRSDHRYSVIKANLVLSAKRDLAFITLGPPLCSSVSTNLFMLLLSHKVLYTLTTRNNN